MDIVERLQQVLLAIDPRNTYYDKYAEKQG